MYIFLERKEDPQFGFIAINLISVFYVTQLCEIENHFDLNCVGIQVFRSQIQFLIQKFILIYYFTCSGQFLSVDSNTFQDLFQANSIVLLQKVKV